MPQQPTFAEIRQANASITAQNFHVVVNIILKRFEFFKKKKKKYLLLVQQKPKTKTRSPQPFTQQK